MELVIKNNTFYVLTVDKEKRAYDTESAAITSLKTMVSQKPDLKEDNMTIFEVTIAEKWEIKSIPWSKIALELIKGGTNDA